MGNEKWIGYAIDILRAASSGTNTINRIAEEINSPPAYTAKIVAQLRNAGLITKEYELQKPLAQMTVREVYEVNHPGIVGATDASSKIQQIILQSLEIPLTQVM